MHVRFFFQELCVVLTLNNQTEPRERAEAAVASLVAVRAREIPPLMNAAATFFFVSQASPVPSMPSYKGSSCANAVIRISLVDAQILSAYFVVLPLRDEGAISLGLDTLPGLFAGSLFLTVIAAPVASLAFSLPSIPKPRVCPCHPSLSSLGQF